MLWKARNDKIFKGINRGIDEVVEEVKVLSWRWVLERMKIPMCLFYEWSWDPRDCLLRYSFYACFLVVFGCLVLVSVAALFLHTVFNSDSFFCTAFCIFLLRVSAISGLL